MKMKSVILGVLIIFLISIYPVKIMISKSQYYNKNVSELRTNNNEINRTFTFFTESEVRLSPVQLIDEAHIVVRGKIQEQIGEYDYYGISENNETYTITRSLYDFNLEEVLKGDKLNSITISIPRSNLSQRLEINKEYILCLFHLKGDYENAYSLISFSQGIYTVDNNILTNMADDTFTIDEYKDIINEVKEKNEKGIEIKKVDLKLN